ncbi:SMP domain-containing protein [Vibrio crassostreae]|nr:SMP domain-containing protein [Vibrio crassostreae]CAK3464845.1 SMP domain-containing protein [Vibrio crassostreae]
MSFKQSKGRIMTNSKTPMTQTAARRIQSAEAKANGGKVAKGSFAAKAQKAAAKNTNN